MKEIRPYKCEVCGMRIKWTYDDDEDEDEDDWDEDWGYWGEEL